MGCLICLAGNDVVPKFKGTTHLSFIKHVLANATLRRGLFSLISHDGTLMNVIINKECYFNTLKSLKCPLPNIIDPSMLTYDEIREMTIRSKDNLNLAVPGSKTNPMNFSTSPQGLKVTKKPRSRSAKRRSSRNSDTVASLA